MPPEAVIEGYDRWLENSLLVGYPDYLFKNGGPFSAVQLDKLARSRVAVGGLGAFGVGAIGLAQLGVATDSEGVLRIADPDIFEDHNANRQTLARGCNLGRNKTEVVENHIRDLVPQARVEAFPDGVTLENLDRFLDGVQVVIDAIDFLAPEVKLELHRRARLRGIPVVASLLVNKGAVGYCFYPDGPSFEEFFAFPAEPALRPDWVLPGSRILVWPTRFPQDLDPGTQAEAERQIFEVLTAERHIASNILAATAFQILLNHMATSVLLGHELPRIPEVLYFDPTMLSMGTVDLAPAMRAQKESVWSAVQSYHDQESQALILEDLRGCESLLEAGVGTAALAVQLAESCSRVTGIENNLGMLARALHLGSQQKAKLKVGEGDAENLFFHPGSFDGYCSQHNLWQLDAERVLSEAHRVLRPGGRLVVTSFQRTPRPELLNSLGLPSTPGLRPNSLKEVKALILRLGFREVTREQVLHQGDSFYLAARK